MSEIQSDISGSAWEHLDTFPFEAAYHAREELNLTELYYGPIPGGFQVCLKLDTLVVWKFLFNSLGKLMLSVGEKGFERIHDLVRGTVKGNN